jgi:hypothetical protein
VEGMLREHNLENIQMDINDQDMIIFIDALRHVNATGTTPVTLVSDIVRHDWTREGIASTPCGQPARSSLRLAPAARFWICAISALSAPCGNIGRTSPRFICPTSNLTSGTLVFILLSE